MKIRLHNLIPFLALLFTLVSCTTKEEANNSEKQNSNIKSPQQKEEPNYLIEIKNGIKTYKNTENKKIVMQGPIDSLNNRNGIWFSYFENGVRNSMTTYNNNGQNHGKSWVNYPSGKRYYEGTWVHGIKTGKWHTYNEDGSLKETKDFKTN